MEVDIRLTAGEIEGMGVTSGKQVVPFSFKVIPLVLLSLLSRDALDRPLAFVLAGGEAMDTREVEVLRETLVEASDGVPFFVFVIVR